MITGILQAKRTFLPRGERRGERSGVAKGNMKTRLSFLIT